MFPPFIVKIGLPILQRFLIGLFLFFHFFSLNGFKSISYSLPPPEKKTRLTFETGPQSKVVVAIVIFPLFSCFIWILDNIWVTGEMLTQTQAVQCWICCNRRQYRSSPPFPSAPIGLIRYFVIYIWVVIELERLIFLFCFCNMSCCTCSFLFVRKREKSIRARGPTPLTLSLHLSSPLFSFAN